MRGLEEFKTWICKLYMVGLTALLPLYAVGGWSRLGDTKYMLFRNMTIFCLVIWLSVSVAECTVKKAMPGRWCAFDMAVLAYCVCVGISAFLSNYSRTAWLGYDGWYMGAVSQWMFAGIYFMFSRTAINNRRLMVIWKSAFMLVIGLGLLHRFGLDPLGLMKGRAMTDWEYSHMISTIGNINWFCGFCCVSVVPLLTAYWKETKRSGIILHLTGIAAALLLLVVQGSDGGIVIAAFCLLFGLMIGMKVRRIFRRTLLLSGVLMLLMPCYSLLVGSRGSKALYAQPTDGMAISVFGWNAWLIGGVATLLIYFGICMYERKKNREISVVECVGIMAFIGFAVLALSMRYLIQGQALEGQSTVLDIFSRLMKRGNGRVELWGLSVKAFSLGDFRQKLFGVGPDCFAEYLYSVSPDSNFPATGGYWEDAIFANAHNEWLNHLINIGIMGTVSYLAIFVTGLVCFRKNTAAMLSIVLYLTVSVIGFQQCLNTPYLFLMLGICEGRMRLDYEMDKV